MKCKNCAFEMNPSDEYCLSCGLKVIMQTRIYTCKWCNHTSDGTELTCPACGVAIDVEQIVNNSGWVQLPKIKDMTRIQFGKSSCQIEGNYVPIADMNLAEGDSIYFAHHILLWRDTQINISTIPMKGALKRLLSGMPVIMTKANGPGRIAFSRDEPGEVAVLPLNQNEFVDVREHTFMVATQNVSYDWNNSNIWFITVKNNGEDRETHYPIGMFLDRFSAPNGHGFLLIHGKGNVFVRTLAPQEEILIQPTSFVFKDSTVNMHLHIEIPRPSQYYTPRCFCLKLIGPGRVAVQSAYEHFHDFGYSITSSSPITQMRWY